MEVNSPKKIKVLPNGPYVVTGGMSLNELQYVPDMEGASLDYKEVKKYPDAQTYSLCRCGHSQNKPYCDGSHVDGFDGAETAGFKSYDEMARLYQGNVIDLMDAKELCAVARFCDTNGSTWELVTEGETEDSAEIAIAQCKHCPSGRLTAVKKNGERIEPQLQKEISILEDVAARVHGPIWVKGGIEVESANGKIYPVRNRMTLCRCGKSENKPFCDASHMNNQGELDS